MLFLAPLFLFSSPGLGGQFEVYGEDGSLRSISETVPGYGWREKEVESGDTFYYLQTDDSGVYKRLSENALGEKKDEGYSVQTGMGQYDIYGGDGSKLRSLKKFDGIFISSDEAPVNEGASVTLDAYGIPISSNP